MKVNKFICSAAIVVIAMITSMSNAQTNSNTTVHRAEIAPRIWQVSGSNAAVVGASGSRVPMPIVTRPADYQYGTGAAYQQPMWQQSACGCQRIGCRGGCPVAPSAPIVTQPSCEGDLCKLSVKKEKETKTCFRTEQETICVPAVRLPWQDCCPPSKSRTRVVTRLKVEKTKVEACSYKWSVDETNDCDCGSPTHAEPSTAPEAMPEPAKEKFKENVVPAAPKAKAALLRMFRQR